jgi:hypothetical protein
MGVSVDDAILDQCEMKVQGLEKAGAKISTRRRRRTRRKAKRS